MANGTWNQPGIDEVKITTVLAEDLSIKGTIQFKNSVMIKGSFEGEIQSDGVLVVGPTAMVNAKIGTKILISHGQIEGDATASEQVVLMSTAVHKGNITTPNIVIESGSKFNGSCTMTTQE
jgi:cytoskeletal protein CcmA (bactofilin family)